MATQKYSVEVGATCTFWYREGTTILHRVGGPAVEFADGTKEWYLNGQLHREDGPAVEFAGVKKQWYLNGQLHREDGPAIECADGTKAWYLNDKLHREDGPAVIWSDDGHQEWWLNGKKMSKKKHTQMTAPVEEMTMAQVEEALGKRIKIIK